MKHEDYVSRLPTAFLRAIEFIQAVVYGIDRVTLWCDGQHAPLIPDNIYDECTDIDVHPNDCKYHRSYTVPTNCPMSICLSMNTRI